MPRVPTPTSARPRNWCRRRTLFSHFQQAVLKDRQVPDHPRGGSGGVIITVGIIRGEPMLLRETSQGSCPLIRADPHGRGHSSGHAYGVIGDNGSRRAPACQKQAIVSRLVAIGGTGGRGRAMCGQDRHPDPEQADAGRSVQREQYPCRAGDPRWRASVACRQYDTIDLAVLAGLKDKDALKGYDVVHFQPFDPVHNAPRAPSKPKTERRSR